MPEPSKRNGGKLVKTPSEKVGIIEIDVSKELIRVNRINGIAKIVLTYLRLIT
ncbi:hypothetical protein IDM33_20045 [Acinetobacter seifertii]|nr:hypothetical protein [Acinetobacter seifertii]